MAPRPAGITRKAIIFDGIDSLIDEGYFSKWRKSSEVAERLNHNIPNHWTQLGSVSTGHFLKRNTRLKYKIGKDRVKDWIIREEGEDDDSC